MKLELAAIGENESFARSAVAAFALFLNPSLTELSDIKTAVSEAVTNCIVHAYRQGKEGDKIVIECRACLCPDALHGTLHIEITDYGCGIDDLERAIAPFYTTLGDEERSGMGFTIMQTFMDDFSVESERGRGTKVKMVKKIGIEAADEVEKRANA